MNESDENGRGGPSGLLSRTRERLTSDETNDDVPAHAGLDDRFTAGVATAWTPDGVRDAGADDRTVADD